MFGVQSHVVLCCGGGAQLVRDHDARRRRSFLQQLAHQMLRGLSVPATLDENVEDEAVLIDGAPQPVFPSCDGDDDLVHAPRIAAPRRAPAHRAGEFSPEFVGPTPDGFKGDVDAAGGQRLLDHVQAQGETKVEPNRLYDDLARETMMTVTGG